ISYRRMKKEDELGALRPNTSEVPIMSEMNRNRPSSERGPRRRHDTSQTRGASPERSGEGSSHQPCKKAPTNRSEIALRVGKVLGTLLLIGIVTSAFMACYAAVYIT